MSSAPVIMILFGRSNVEIEFLHYPLPVVPVETIIGTIKLHPFIIFHQFSTHTHTHYTDTFIHSSFIHFGY